jgi:hypothetical protein
MPTPIRPIEGIMSQIANPVSVERIDKSRMVELLHPLGFEIGQWNEIKIAGTAANKGNYVRIKAPQNARELFVFSQHVAGWLPIGNVRLLQFDYSTSLSLTENLLLSRWLFGTSKNEIFPNTSHILLQQQSAEGRVIDVVIAQIIDLLLLFECHAEFVSADSSNTQILSIQDGYVYFVGATEVPDVVSQFEHNRSRSPQWVINMHEKED